MSRSPYVLQLIYTHEHIISLVPMCDSSFTFYTNEHSQVFKDRLCDNTYNIIEH